MHQYGESFRKGECSLEEAANHANVSLWRMLDYVRKQNLWPKDTLEDALAELQHARSLKIYKTTR